ncbi:MAG: nuclear transport factor 2 family protein [Mycobacteriales bacterium]
MTSPYEAIRNLLGTYCLLIDAGDLDGLGELFAEAVLLDDSGREVARGAAQCTALWRRMVHLYDGSPRTRHTVSAPVIDVEGETAVCRSSFVVFQQLGAGRLEPVAAGRYRDTFAGDGGTWRFTSRQFFLDQLGDVSQHMVGA